MVANQEAIATATAATMATKRGRTAALGNVYKAKKVKLELLEDFRKDPRKLYTFFF